MTPAITALRLAAFLTCALGLLFTAAAVVPATTLAVQGRVMVFVLAVPWLVAAIVVHPRRLARAISALVTGEGDEGVATARALDLIGGLTLAVGAVGVFASDTAFTDTTALTKQAIRPHDVLPGIILAMTVAPAFALIVRFVLYEPVVVSLRRRHAPEGEPPEGRATMHTAWKVILVAVASVLVVEGFRALFLRPAPRAEEPPRDTTFLVVGTNHDTGGQSPDLGPDHPGAGKPILVTIARGEEGITCRVDGEPVAAQPGQADELYERLRALKAKEASRRIEIRSGLDVPFGLLLAAVDAGTRLPVPAWAEVGVKGEGRVRVVTPYGPLPLVVRCRMGHEVFERGVDIVYLDLPVFDGVEKVAVDRERGNRCVNITYDAEQRVSELYVKRDLVCLDELKAIVHRSASLRRDPATGVSELEFSIRCDRHTPIRKICEVLMIFAEEDLLVQNVLIAVRPPWHGSDTSGMTYE